MKACRIYRLLIAWKTENDRQLPLFLKNHMECCQCCEDFEKKQSGIAWALRKGFTHPESNQSTYLRNRVAARLGEINQQKPAMQWSPVVQFASAIALVTILAIQGWSLREATLAKNEGASGAASQYATTDKLIRTLPDAAAKSLTEWRDELSRPPVLEMEMAMAMADARMAMESLASEFLPARLRASLAFSAPSTP